MKVLNNSDRLDHLGIAASVACAIHCALLPFVISILPLIGLEFLANTWVEITMIGLSVIIGIWSLTKSLHHHRNIIPIILLVLGFTLIANGHFLWQEMEAILVPLGGITIAVAHYINWKYNRVCSYKNNV